MCKTTRVGATRDEWWGWSPRGGGGSRGGSMICGEPGGPRARQDALITSLNINQPVIRGKLEKGPLNMGNFVVFSPLQRSILSRYIDQKISPVGTRGHKGLTARRLGPSRRVQAPPVRCHPASLTTCNNDFHKISLTHSCPTTLDLVFLFLINKLECELGFNCTGRFNFSEWIR